MAFLLGRGSAVEWLRQNTSQDLLQKRWPLSYSILECSRTRLERHLPQLEGLSIPYQLIVWNDADRRRTSLTKSYRLVTPDGTYPAIRIMDELYVSSPEFTFLQMASVLDEEHLQFLGFELCGRYGIGDSGAFLRVQTTTPEMLEQFARIMKRVHGRRRALDVIPYVLGGAASPMEAALTLMLCAPREEGGYGLEAPELNRSLPVEGRARSLWVDDHITPDFLWKEQGLVIEYDSDLHHSASDRIAHDAARRDVLTEMGYRVITVTTRHVKSYREMDRIAHIVSSCLGTSISPQNEAELNGRAAYQARKRRLATHPAELCAIPSADIKRAWRPKHPSR